MKKLYRLRILVLFVSLLALLAAVHPPAAPISRFPYKQAGLSDAEAAAHLLSRFSFGARPGEVDVVVKMGLENWFALQLGGALPDDSLQALLAAFPSLKMSNEEIVSTYPKPAQVLAQARREGVIRFDSASAGNSKQDYRKEARQYMQSKGMKPQAELFRELINQKILRAAYSRNQLTEVLTDFWFNHFNVSLTKGEDRQFVTVYERDAIRPHVLGRFEAMLLATAKSPAMLTYLDNFRSVAEEKPKALPARRQQRMMQRLEEDSSMQGQMVKKLKAARGAQGLNENYAREIMELHTLGVDGGYTQQDVTQAARIFTGWTLYPMGQYGKGTADRLVERLGEDQLQKRGFVRDGDFLFMANRHDRSAKQVLGTTFPAGGGYEEGLKLISLLASHPSTARFISRKLAVRFVSDNPPAALVDRMAKTFLEKNGDIKEVLLTMVAAREFWDKEALREKTKSPFELAISAVRGLDARINAPYQLYTWITRMGQQLYAYQAPTGFPDRGQYWINTGSLLNRMNFGLALSAQRIPGITLNLAALNGGHEPESAEAALETYAKLLLPGRNTAETVKRLRPMLADPELANKIEAAAAESTKQRPRPADPEEEEEMEAMQPKGKNNKGLAARKGGVKGTNRLQPASETRPATMLSQVVGIILGSPEYQRR
jgi:uncharacterized protein (DUF1800 family)